MSRKDVAIPIIIVLLIVLLLAGAVGSLLLRGGDDTNDTGKVAERAVDEGRAYDREKWTGSYSPARNAGGREVSTSASGRGPG